MAKHKTRRTRDAAPTAASRKKEMTGINNNARKREIAELTERVQGLERDVRDLHGRHDEMGLRLAHLEADRGASLE